MSGTLQVAGLQTQGPGSPDSQIGPFTYALSQVQWNAAYNLVLGANTITVPPAAVAAQPAVILIIPPLGGFNTTLQLAGLYLSPNLPTLWAIDPANVPASFVLTAGAAVTVTIQAG